ncbi:MAG: flagellar basal body P-ring formation chaperone FlgA [Rhodanobacter sp.]
MTMLRLLSLLLLIAVSPTVLAAPRASQQRVAAAHIVAAARARLDARLGSEAVAAKVSVVGVPVDVSVPAGAVSLAVRPLTGRWPRTRIGVPVDVMVDGQVARSATVWFALELQRQVLGYAADAPMGTAAGSLKLVPCDVNFAAARGKPVQDSQQLDGMRLRHAVLAGSMARIEDFERVPDVDRQQRVHVELALGAIHMQARGTAIAPGNAGDVVAVLVDDAESPVRARVVDKGEVEVVR